MGGKGCRGKGGETPGRRGCSTGGAGQHDLDTGQPRGGLGQLLRIPGQDVVAAWVMAGWWLRRRGIARRAAP